MAALRGCVLAASLELSSPQGVSSYLDVSSSTSPPGGVALPGKLSLASGILNVGKFFPARRATFALHNSSDDEIPLTDYNLSGQETASAVDTEPVSPREMNVDSAMNFTRGSVPTDIGPPQPLSSIAKNTLRELSNFDSLSETPSPSEANGVSAPDSEETSPLMPELVSSELGWSVPIFQFEEHKKLLSSQTETCSILCEWESKTSSLLEEGKECSHREHGEDSSLPMRTVLHRKRAQELGCLHTSEAGSECGDDAELSQALDDVIRDVFEMKTAQTSTCVIGDFQSAKNDFQRTLLPFQQGLQLPTLLDYFENDAMDDLREMEDPTHAYDAATSYIIFHNSGRTEIIEHHGGNVLTVKFGSSDGPASPMGKRRLRSKLYKLSTKGACILDSMQKGILDFVLCGEHRRYTFWLAIENDLRLYMKTFADFVTTELDYRAIVDPPATLTRKTRIRNTRARLDTITEGTSRRSAREAQAFFQDALEAWKPTPDFSSAVNRQQLKAVRKYFVRELLMVVWAFFSYIQGDPVVYGLIDMFLQNKV